MNPVSSGPSSSESCFLLFYLRRAPNVGVSRPGFKVVTGVFTGCRPVTETASLDFFICRWAQGPLLHRNDEGNRQTPGVLVVAKTTAVYRYVIQQSFEKLISKLFLLLTLLKPWRSWLLKEILLKETSKHANYKILVLFNLKIKEGIYVHD